MRLHLDNKLKIFPLILFLFLLSVPLSQTILMDNPDLPLVKNPPTVITFANTTGTVNNSIFWDGHPFNISRYELWQRLGTTLSPATSGDDVLTIGNFYTQSDSSKSYWGASDDVSLHFDGTSFNFTNEVGDFNYNFDNNITTTGTGIFGKVGIGTPTPATTLEVEGIARITEEGSETYIQMQATSGFGEVPSGMTLVSNGDDFSIYPSSSGTTGDQLTMAYFNGTTWYSALEYAHVSSGYSDLVLMKSGGNVGIGVTDPDVKLEVDGNVNVSGNITSANVFIPQYIFAHNNRTMPVADANVWTNVTFDQELSNIMFGISHINDSTNETFTINEDGIYEVDFDFDVEDTSVGASDIDVSGRLAFINGTEIVGSIFEVDLTRQGAEVELSHDFLIRCFAGEQFKFQFIASDSDVQISTHGTYGDHPESATIVIKKIANLQ